MLNLKKLENFLFHLLVFLLPTQLAYHFWPEYAFIFGVRVDYLAPAVYLTDLLVVFLIALSRTKIKTIWLLAIGLLAIGNIISSISPWVSFCKWVKILEFIYFAKYIYDHKKLLTTHAFAKALSLSLILISLIGVGQFLSGRTLGFTLLGERTFTSQTPGIALQEISGGQYLRAYSIFSHPNSFAGYLFVSMVLFFPFLRKVKFFWFTILFSAIAFLLTFSLSAFIGTLFGLPLLFSKIDLTTPEITERLQLIGVAKEFIYQNHLFGTGLGTFPLLNSLMQPVHNIFLLALTETGIVGLGAICFTLYAIFKSHKYLFIFVLITGLFDHYWLTLQQNMLLLALVYGYIFGRGSKG